MLCEITFLTSCSSSVENTTETTQATTQTVATETTQAKTVQQTTTAETTQTTTVNTTQTITAETVQATTIEITQITTDATIQTTIISEIETELLSLEALSEQADLKLRDDFAVYMSDMWGELTASDMIVMYYYGTYDGCEVVVMYGREYSMTDDMNIISVAGQEISLPSGSLSVLVHKDSTFIDINDAYDQGYLSTADIKAIKYYSE